MTTRIWRKVSRSGAGNDSVELAWDGDSVAVRGSKTPDVPELTFSPAEVAMLFEQIKRDQRHGFTGQIRITLDSSGGFYRLFAADFPYHSLGFDPQEWNMFLEGIRAGELTEFTMPRPSVTV